MWAPRGWALYCFVYIYMTEFIIFSLWLPCLTMPQTDTYIWWHYLPVRYTSAWQNKTSLQAVVWAICKQRSINISIWKSFWYCQFKILSMRLCNMTHITRKQSLRSLSLSYQKKDGCAWLCPSFFWYDTDLSEFDSVDIIFLKSRCHAKRRMGAATHAHPSCGMTRTKTLRSVFS